MKPRLTYRHSKRHFTTCNTPIGTVDQAHDLCVLHDLMVNGKITPDEGYIHCTDLLTIQYVKDHRSKFTKDLYLSVKNLATI